MRAQLQALFIICCCAAAAGGRALGEPSSDAQTAKHAFLEEFKDDYGYSDGGKPRIDELWQRVRRRDRPAPALPPPPPLADARRRCCLHSTMPRCWPRCRRLRLGWTLGSTT